MLRKTLAFALLPIAICLADCSYSNSSFATVPRGEKKAKVVLAETFNELVSQNRIDTSLLAEVCALRLRMGDEAGAAVAFSYLMANGVARRLRPLG
jgi:hypothetical protein